MIVSLFVSAAILIYGTWKWDWFRKRIFNSQYIFDITEALKSFLKIILIWMLLGVLVWSILNYWFFINMHILMNDMGYGFKESIRICRYLTDEYTTMFFYSMYSFRKYIAQIMGNTDENIIEQVTNDLKYVIETIEPLQTISDIDSGYSLFKDIIKILS